MANINPILNTDGYKLSHARMYPPNATQLYSYIEARGVSSDFKVHPAFKEDPEIVHFGSKIISEKLLNEWVVTNEHFREAEEILESYGIEWNKAGFRKIIDVYGGYFPVNVYGLLDGTVITDHVPQLAIYNTDPEMLWAVSYLETALLSIVWQGSTVATLSRAIKRVINRYLDISTDTTEGLPFKLHDFGQRGTSESAAMIAGLAHLVNFQGTDTLLSLLAGKRYFNATSLGFSVPASEHSTITSWGREHEVDAYRNFLNIFGKPGAIISCVSDSYDIFNACENLWGGDLRQQVIDSGAVLVVRPDSGDPVDVVFQVVSILADRFGTTTNSKGYRVLNNVRVLQGDGVNALSIGDILNKLVSNGFSADNVVFGMGGQLLQAPTRDSLKYAMKASAVKVAGKWRDVYKDPITDQGKRSSAGIVVPVKYPDGSLYSSRVKAIDDVQYNSSFTRLYDLQQMSQFVSDFIPSGYYDTFDQVRARAKL
ncbi:nicotinamide phosphoribosyltransferase protein [Rhizobium phage RHph_I1_18]|nr:nicotinamide phosphoribosyltransferase protein [Rhizobium phage RHph_I1_18]